jgi:aminopeptidase N
MPSLTVDEARTRAQLLSVDAYDVALDLTAGDQIFRSRTAIRFRAAETGAESFVDVKPRRLLGATLNGRRLGVDALRDGRLPLPGLEERNELVVEAEMAYSRDGEGLHRAVDPADGEPYLYAMAFLAAAPRIFACFDQPDLKAPYALSVTAPRAWSVLGNGAATQVEPGRWQLATTRPLSTYFVTLVAGPYHSIIDQHDGIPLGLHVKASLAPHLDKDAGELLRVTAQSFDAYHRLFGIRYPFGEYHQVFVPEFNAGAMENPGCVTFRDGLVFRSKVTDGERSNRARTIVHEMAHQWFGDLVTMRWWDDLWLNESFAEYMAYRVCDSDTDFTDSWVDFAYIRKRWGMVADQRPSTHPIAGNGAQDALSALNDFDGISYAKGAAALKQLNVYLGDDTFLAGVRAHLRDHSYANATLADLLGSWEAAGASDLDRWAHQWLRLPGADTISVDSVSVDQRSAAPALRRTPPRTTPADRPHRLSVTSYGRNGPGRTAVVEVVEERTPLPFDADAEHPVLLPDSGDDTWAKVRLPDSALAALPDVLPHLDDPVARAVIWNSLLDALADADLDPRRYLELLESALPAESEDIALTLLLGGAARLLGRYLPGRDSTDRTAAVALRCLDAAPPGSARQLAAASGFVATTTEPGRLQSWLAGGDLPEGLELDAELRWAVVLRLSALGAIEQPGIAAELERDNSAEGAVHAARCRAARPDHEAKRQTWAAIAGDGDLSNYELYAMCEGFWQPEQGQLCAPYVPRYFTDLPATADFRSGWVVQESSRLVYPAYAVEPVTLELAEAALARDDLAPGVRRSIVDATDDLRRALASRQRYAGSG